MVFIGISALVLLISFSGLSLFKRLKILDKPGPDLPPRKSVPTMQGVFLVIGFALCIIIFFNQYLFDYKVLGFLIGAGLLFLISLWDEIKRFDNFKSVSSKIRLVCQILATFAVFFIGGIGLHKFVLPTGVEIEFHRIIALLLTLIWFVGFMNAINWFDGVYGLATGISSVGFLTIFLLIKFVVLGYYTDITPERMYILQLVMDFSLLLFIVSLVYTIIEFKPFGLVRDIGVMFLGFSLAYLSLLGGAKIGTILVVLSLPIFDAAWVFFNRIFKMKKSPLKGDYTHLHYRLLAMGWNRSEIRMFIWGFAIVLMILMILQGANRLNKIVIFLLMFMIFFGVNIYLFWFKKFPMEYKPKK